MLRFGFGTHPSESVERMVHLIQTGERLNYDMAWVADQTFFHDPFVVLGQAALRTEKIKLMLGVTNPYTRHPVQVARAAASLDEVSGGRFHLGYGAGNRKELIVPMGLEQTEAGPRSREAIQIVRRLLAGECLSYESPWLRLDGVELKTEPHPAVPIYLAGRGSYILRTAGALADGVVIGALVSPEGFRFALDHVAKGAQESGRSLESLDIVSWVGVQFLDDREADLDLMRASTAHIIGGAPHATLQTVGLADMRIAYLKEIYQRLGPEGAAPYVTEDEIALFKLYGDADELANRIQRLADAGATQLGILLTQPTHAEQEAFLQRFATEVMPRFR